MLIPALSFSLQIDYHGNQVLKYIYVHIIYVSYIHISYYINVHTHITRIYSLLNILLVLLLK